MTEVQPPENNWTDLTDERRALIDARDLAGWTLKQLRTEVDRRLPFRSAAAVAYWIERLERRESELRAQREIESVPQHLGLRVVPDDAYALWRYRLIHVPSGKDLLLKAVPDNVTVKKVRLRLLELGDWTLPQDQWSNEQVEALMQERERFAWLP